jgi:Domain of unknown function (DUF4253)
MQKDWLSEATQHLAKLSNAPVRPYFTVDFGRTQNPAGISVLVPHPSARPLVNSLRKELPPGAVAFMGTTQSAEDEEGVEVVVGPGKTKFDCVLLAQTDAPNFNLDTKSLVSTLQRYDRQLDIDIFLAESDALTFAIGKPPKDWQALAEDISKFCPDIVEQGVGSIETLAELIQRTNQVGLWWD